MDLSKFRHASKVLMSSHIGPRRTVLSEREQQVMFRLAKGEPIGKIAKALKISASSASTYRTRILKKLRLTNDAELCVFIHEQQCAGVIQEMQAAGVL